MKETTALATLDATNLAVLNALVKEFNDLVAHIEGNPLTKEGRVVEYSKCYGLAANISGEAVALMGDITKIIGTTSAPQPKDSSGLMETLFGTKSDKRN